MPPPREMEDALAAWELFLHDTSLPPLIHYQFEAIHPFLGGNGRVGRLLITLFLVERGILPSPLLYLSAFFEATRPHYYDHLRRVSEAGEWEEWLLYFLRAAPAPLADQIPAARGLPRRQSLPPDRTGRPTINTAPWSR